MTAFRAFNLRFSRYVIGDVVSALNEAIGTETKGDADDAATRAVVDELEKARESLDALIAKAEDA